MIQWHTQAGKITTNLKIKIDFTLTEFGMTKTVTWNYHVDDSAKGTYDMILGIDILTTLGLNLKFSDHVIEADYKPFKRYTAPMVYLVEYEFKCLKTEEITLE